MLKYFWVTLLTMFSLPSFAQQKAPILNSNLQNTKSLNLYIGYTFLQGSAILNGHFNHEYIFKPAFQWSDKKLNFNEVAINSSFLDQFNGYISVQYDYTLNFSKHKQTNWIPALSFGAAPYLLWHNSVVNNTSEFPSHYTEFGIRYFVQPKLTYYLSSNFFMNLNIPIYFMSMDIDHSRNEAPSLRPDQQNYTILNGDGGALGVGICLGIGWKF